MDSIESPADDFVPRETRRSRLCRLLLYGSPFVAALLAISVIQIIAAADFVSSWPVGWIVVITHGLLAGLTSAAGAVWLPNRLALRVLHALSAGFVSMVVYWVLILAAGQLLGR